MNGTMLAKCTMYMVYASIVHNVYNVFIAYDVYIEYNADKVYNVCNLFIVYEGCNAYHEYIVHFVHNV